MLYPEDTKFLLISIAAGIISIVCFCENMLFGAMACFILSLAGISSHFRARAKEKKRKKEQEDSPGSEKN
ncbi:MAG: hypothetical protein J5842_04595 [Lachnospiraceae bacterium]|nr:hypothetical protein [Lachnospiraceae bacterium]